MFLEPKIQRGCYKSLSLRSKITVFIIGIAVTSWTVTALLYLFTSQILGYSFETNVPPAVFGLLLSLYLIIAFFFALIFQSAARSGMQPQPIMG